MKGEEEGEGVKTCILWYFWIRILFPEILSFFVDESFLLAPLDRKFQYKIFWAVEKRISMTESREEAIIFFQWIYQHLIKIP